MNTRVNGTATENLTEPTPVLNSTNMATPGRNIFIYYAIVYKQKSINYFQNHFEMIPNFIPTECTCAGKSNRWGEGSECKSYNGNYEGDWYNGTWCYANVENCSDAKAHPAGPFHNVTGYGASKAACGKGIY